MGFYSIRYIEVGHEVGSEVIWDYGVKGEEWSGSLLVKDVVIKGKTEQKEKVVSLLCMNTISRP